MSKQPSSLGIFDHVHHVTPNRKLFASNKIKNRVEQSLRKRSHQYYRRDHIIWWKGTVMANGILYRLVQ